MEVCCDLRFHEVFKTTITRQITKENEEIEKILKNAVKNRWNCVQISVCVCVCVYVCVCLCVCVCEL